MKFTDEQIVAIKGFCDEMAISFQKVADARSHQKDCVENVMKRYEFPREARKVLKKMARVQFQGKAKFEAVVQESEEFQETYRNVFGVEE